MKQLTLISNWRQAWRMASVQMAAVIVAWAALPADMQAAIVQAVGVPAERVPGVLALLVIVARLIDQPRTRGEP
jgi:hypothetical protein